MSHKVLKRPSLGQVATLGALYDGWSDNFIPLSLLKTPPPKSAVHTTQKHSTDLKFSKTDTYKDKFDRLGVDAELSASFLAGLVKVEGSGRYLSEKRDSNRTLQSSMHYSITTAEEELNLTTKEVRECLAFDTLESDIATHVVTGISWGAHCVVTAKSQLAVSQDSAQIAGALEAQLDFLKVIAGTSGNVELAKDTDNKQAEQSFEVTVYGDVLANDGLVPTDFESAQKFISNVPKYIATANNGKGQPMVYTLLPLSMLSKFRILEIKADIVLKQLSVECLEKFVQLFDGLRDAQQVLCDYYARLRHYASVVPPSHITSIADQLSKARAAEAALKSDYAEMLKKVRAGQDAQQLWRLLHEFRNGECTAEMIKSAMIYTEKIDFVEAITRAGATYIGYQGPAVDTVLFKNRYDDAFILYFNDDLRNHFPSWNDNAALLLELLRDTALKRLILAVDCDATGQPLEKPHVCHMRNVRILVEDVVEEQKKLANKCIMRCNENAMDRFISSKPLQRRAVKIPCPGRYCDRTLRCAWICETCQSIVEYGVVDDRLYCACGSCQFTQWKFKCKDFRHGSAWAGYDSGTLLSLLQALEPFEQLNILLVGEPGVGKSTWINALINYLTYDTLNEALSAEDLRWVIPCSFSTQLKDSRGQFVQKDIKIGSTEGEEDGICGQSATKCTTVYAIDIGNIRVRLIDTPGIGDTQGAAQGYANMEDILNVLRSYSKLHGIIVLSKPNATPTTVNSINQLLSCLHRDAANNIVFGFTNTRGSNYKPGDTFRRLETLLQEYKAAQIGLYEHNVYCFDSESFRYLAAWKKGIDMGHLEDNIRSWQYSFTECERLVKHFQSLKPHLVRSTLNLNETRKTIQMLTLPIVHIMRAIQSNIDLYDDQIKDISKRELSRMQLERSLYRNESVNMELMANIDDIKLLREANRRLKAVIEESKLEYNQIQEAAAQFVVFLKRHAIAPCNDTIVSYFDHIIREEECKIQAGGGNTRHLEELRIRRQTHIEKVQKLTKALEQGENGDVLEDNGVSRLIDSLYGLRHYGKNFRNVVQATERAMNAMAVNEKAGDATFREKSFNISVGPHWGQRGRAKSNKS